MMQQKLAHSCCSRQKGKGTRGGRGRQLWMNGEWENGWKSAKPLFNLQKNGSETKTPVNNGHQRIEEERRGQKHHRVNATNDRTLSGTSGIVEEQNRKISLLHTYVQMCFDKILQYSFMFLQVKTI
jgi:hypothetical protein